MRVLQAQKAQKLLKAAACAKARRLRQNFKEWKQWHAVSLDTSSHKMLLALQYMTGQRIGVSGSCWQFLPRLPLRKSALLKSATSWKVRY